MARTIDPNGPLVWTAQRLQAAELFADGDFTTAEIATKLKISPAALVRWKRHPDFPKKIEEFRAAIGDAVQERAIGRKLRRLRNLNDRYHKLIQVMKDRAADPTVQDLPGGSTGLVVVVEKTVVRETVRPLPPRVDAPASQSEPERAPEPARAPEPERVTRTVVRETTRFAQIDYKLLEELREMEKQAAIEAGQWQEEAAPAVGVNNVVINIAGQLDAFTAALVASANRERVTTEAEALGDDLAESMDPARLPPPDDTTPG